MSLNTQNSSEHKLRFTDMINEPKRMLPPIKGFENLDIVSLEKSIEPLIPIVPEIDQMIYIVKQNCLHPEDGLSRDESGSIMLYSLEWDPRDASFYFLLNKTLRSENRQLIKPWFLYLRLLLHSLSKLPSFSRTIYRGVKMNLINDYPIDRTFVWWAFSSCTDSVGTLENEDFFGQNGTRTLFAIECSTGINIRKHSIFPNENEVLLIAARQFQVVSHLNAGHDLHIIQIKETQSPFPFISYSPSTITSYQNEILENLIDKYQFTSDINLDNQNLNDQDMKIIVQQLILNKQCRKLSLQNNHLTSESALIIAETLKSNRYLEELMLYHNYLSDIGIQHLSRALSSNSSVLKILGIGWNGITDCGVEYLSKMIRENRSLLTLGLVFNEITDDGLKLLVDAILHSQTNLQILHLSKNKLITDGCINSFIQMMNRNHLSLKELWIQNCNLSQNGKQRLKQTIKSKTYFRLEL